MCILCSVFSNIDICILKYSTYCSLMFNTLGRSGLDAGTISMTHFVVQMVFCTLYSILYSEFSISLILQFNDSLSVLNVL